MNKCCTLIISPIIPHFSSECLEELKISDSEKWPKKEKKYLIDENVNIVVQINSKKKIVLNMKKDIDENSLIQEIKKDLKINEILVKSNLIKTIYVKNKLINFIVQ